jgi:hypothetical protein
MKYSLLFFAFIFNLMNIAYSQSVLSASKPFKLERGKYLSELKKENMIDNAAIISLANTNSAIILSLSGEFYGDKEQKRKYLSDSLYKLYKARKDSLKSESLKIIVDKLNEQSPFSPLFTAGVSNLENTKQSYGSLSLGLQFRLTNYKIAKNNWIDPHFLYLMFSAKTASSPDSASAQKNFLFPELRDFVLGYFCQFLKNDWAVSPTFEFSLNRFEDTISKKLFISQSLTTGIRIQKSFSHQNINSFVSLFPYYSLILVDKKYKEDYQDLLKEVKIPSKFHSLGLNVSAQFPNAILFCNMKYILNKEGELKSRDLKRFVYTIGTLLSL